METDEDLAGTGLQRPRINTDQPNLLAISEPEPSGENVPIPESFSSRRTLDTEVLMESTPDPIQDSSSSMASDLACNIFFNFLFIN